MHNNSIQISEISKIFDCEHKTAALVGVGIPSIRTPNIGKGRLVLEKVNQVSEDTYRLWTRRAIPEAGDLILAREAPVGNVAIIPKNTRVCLGQRTVLIKPDRKKVCPEYLNYFLNSSAINSFLITISNGATVGHLNVSDIRRLSFATLPSLSIQRKIGAILSAYDDLIENNKQRIVMLEKIAEEIYREWFVRLRFPGYEKTKFVKGIPDGWRIMPIGNLISSYIGGGWGEDFQSIIFSKPAYVIRGTDIPNLSKGEFAKNILRYHKQSNFNSRKLFEDDIVFEVSGGSKEQLLGRTLHISKGLLDFFEDNVICASFCKLLRPNKQIISSLYLKYFFRIYYESGMVGTFQTQSTGISNYHFEDFIKYQTLIVPNMDILNTFDSIVSKLMAIKDILAQKNNILIKTRDILLPRLLSGKLFVEDLDIQFPKSMEEDYAELHQ